MESHLNPLTPMSDQDRISPYSINDIKQTSNGKRKKIRGLLIHP